MSFDPKERWRGRFELVNNDLRFMWLGPGPIVLSLGKISLIFDPKKEVSLKRDTYIVGNFSLFIIDILLMILDIMYAVLSLPIFL